MRTCGIKAFLGRTFANPSLLTFTIDASFQLYLWSVLMVWKALPQHMITQTLIHLKSQVWEAMQHL